MNQERLAFHQAKGNLIDAEECLRSAYATDVRPFVREWRRSKGLPEDPLMAFRASGYLETIAVERAGREVVSGAYC